MLLWKVSENPMLSCSLGFLTQRKDFSVKKEFWKLKKNCYICSVKNLEIKKNLLYLHHIYKWYLIMLKNYVKNYYFIY